MKNEIEEEAKDFQKGYLTLPFNEEQFREFIKGLLGAPQTITKRIKGDFEIHLKDLQNFHDLINQRVTQQNNGKLIQLKTQIYYSDQSSVLLSTYQELVTYNEVKPVISEAVRMTWSYLIQFADKTVPEKQEIELMIISSPQGRGTIVDEIERAIPFSGYFSIDIKHTARSWGSDLESLITNQVNSILIRCPKWKEYLSNHSSTIGLLVAVLFLFSALASIFVSTRSFNIAEIAKVTEFINGNTDLNSKSDYLLNYIAQNSQNLFFLKSQLFIVVAIFISIVLGILTGTLANNKPRSYLVLTRESKKNRDKMIEKHKRQTIWFCVSIVMSIVTGIASNYIFKWLTGV